MGSPALYAARRSLGTRLARVTDDQSKHSTSLRMVSKRRSPPKRPRSAATACWIACAALRGAMPTSGGQAASLRLPVPACQLSASSTTCRHRHAVGMPGEFAPAGRGWQECGRRSVGVLKNVRSKSSVPLSSHGGFGHLEPSRTAASSRPQRSRGRDPHHRGGRRAPRPLRPSGAPPAYRPLTTHRIILRCQRCPPWPVGTWAALSRSAIARRVRPQQEHCHDPGRD